MARPIRFACRSLFSPEERRELDLEPELGYRCTGHCDESVRAATFRHPRRTEEYVILHPSTKYPGKWQLSWFDEDGPWSDTEVASCDAGVAELLERWPVVRREDGRVVPGIILEEWA